MRLRVHIVPNASLSLSQLSGYKSVLLTGCRCIEVACYNGLWGEPMVSNGSKVPSGFKFSALLKCIQVVSLAQPSSRLPTGMGWDVGIFPTRVAFCVHLSCVLELQKCTNKAWPRRNNA